MKTAAKRRLIKNKTPVKTTVLLAKVCGIFMSGSGHTLGGAGVYLFGGGL